MPPPNAISIADLARISQQLADGVCGLPLRSEGFTVADDLSLDGNYLVEYVDGCLQALPMPDFGLSAKAADDCVRRLESRQERQGMPAFLAFFASWRSWPVPSSDTTGGVRRGAVSEFGGEPDFLHQAVARVLADWLDARGLPGSTRRLGRRWPRSGCSCPIDFIESLTLR